MSTLLITYLFKMLKRLYLYFSSKINQVAIIKCMTKNKNIK